MALRYDFHIHSCLSPCGDESMTPANITAMAKLLELDCIALTDHNSAGNCAAAIEAGARAGVLVLPGMELCTAEEAHVVCLFAELAQAQRFSALVRDALPPIGNRPDIFGSQLFMDADDNCIGSEELLLGNASAVTIDRVVGLCGEHGGVCYPAHIDRASFSVLSSLGGISPDWGFSLFELTPRSDEGALRAGHAAIAKLPAMRSSDAHDLETLAAHEARTLEGLSPGPSLSAAAVVSLLRETPPREKLETGEIHP